MLTIFSFRTVAAKAGGPGEQPSSRCLLQSASPRILYGLGANVSLVRVAVRKDILRSISPARKYLTMGVKLVSILALVAVHSPLTSALLARDTLPAALQSCLQKTGAEVLYPGDQNYNALATPQNSNYQVHPGVIVIPASTQQIAATVKCVAAEKGDVKLSPRGGGHSYAAYSFAGQVVIDPGRMKGISVDGKKKEVTVQFGQTLGPMATAIGKKGYALPHGTCPTVGVAGHALGGGWGYASRKWGWLVDRSKSFNRLLQ